MWLQETFQQIKGTLECSSLHIHRFKIFFNFLHFFGWSCSISSGLYYSGVIPSVKVNKCDFRGAIQILPFILVTSAETLDNKIQNAILFFLKIPIMPSTKMFRRCKDLGVCISVYKDTRLAGACLSLNFHTRSFERSVLQINSFCVVEVAIQAGPHLWKQHRRLINISI